MRSDIVTAARAVAAAAAEDKEVTYTFESVTRKDMSMAAISPECFERIVLKHIIDIIPAGLDQYQFAYRENRSTEDAVSIALHTALTHLQLPNTYMRMLFVDFSSAFNTVIPDKLILKLHNLGLPSSLCHWIRDFLTNRPQVVRIGDNTSSTLVLSTGTPQGCVLSPALFTLFTSDCSAIHSTNTIVKFEDDTTIVGLISHNDETHYRERDPAPYSMVNIRWPDAEEGPKYCLHRPYPPGQWIVCLYRFHLESDDPLHGWGMGGGGLRGQKPAGARVLERPILHQYGMGDGVVEARPYRPGRVEPSFHSLLYRLHTLKSINVLIQRP
ncbi:hypothetical protein L3Q82_005035 [Scortum barcoo]|uniref:Uncharacterized protein n=1 Tax=Scortum barcoo TaxID=214431 RepID=A0ACB8VE15_9TELE|nr:hypothetical protein L3Q82_005035 [Scortum barcoo]